MARATPPPGWRAAVPGETSDTRDARLNPVGAAVFAPGAGSGSRNVVNVFELMAVLKGFTKPPEFCVGQLPLPRAAVGRA